MKVQEIVDRATKDPQFAEELAAKAMAAAQQMRGGTEPNGEPWHQLISVFAEGPEELDRLKGPGQTVTAGTKRTTATLATTTTSICTVTVLTVASTIV